MITANTYPVPEHAGHKPTAQLLAKAYHTVLGAGVDFELEALGSLKVLNEELAFLLRLVSQLGTQLGVSDELLGSLDMILADVVDDALGSFEEVVLRDIVSGRGRNGAEVLEDVQQPDKRAKKKPALLVSPSREGRPS